MKLWNYEIIKFERLSGESVKLRKRKRNRKKNCPSTSMNSTPILQWLDVPNVISWEIDWGMESQLCNVKLTRGRKKKRRREGKRKHLLAMQCRVSQAESGVVRLAAWRRHRGRGKYPLPLIFPALLLHVSKCNWLGDGSAREESLNSLLPSNFTANFTPNYFTPGLFLEKLPRMLMKVFIVSRNFIVAISLH